MGAALRLCEHLELSDLAVAPPQLRLVASNANSFPGSERPAKTASRANLRLVEDLASSETETRLKATSSSEFTGKEEDVEVGLQYFGKRYLNPLLGRWVSADPLAVHAPGEADLNVYAYVSGTVLKSIDPLGLEDEQVSSGGASSTEESADAENTSSEGGASSNAPEEGQDAGTGQEGAPSQGPVTSAGSEGTDSIPKLLPLVAVSPLGGAGAAVIGLGVLILGHVTADQPAAEGTAEHASREKGSALGEIGLAMMGGGAAPRAAARSAAAEVTERSAAQLSQQVAEISSKVAPALRTIGDDAARGLPETANFAQKTFGRMFSKGGAFAGRSVDDVAGALRSGAMKPLDVPIDYIVRDGNTLILNTRCAQALQAAGIPRSAWTAVNRTGQEMFENMLTGQLQRNGLTSAGTAVVRQSGL